MLKASRVGFTTRAYRRQAHDGTSAELPLKDLHVASTRADLPYTSTTSLASYIPHIRQSRALTLCTDTSTPQMSSAMHPFLALCYLRASMMVLPIAARPSETPSSVLPLTHC